MREPKADWTIVGKRHVTQMLKRARPGLRMGLLAFSILTLCAAILGATGLAAAAAGPPSPGVQDSGDKTAASGDFAGDASCATCHEEVAKAFAANPHSKLAEQHGKAGVTCEGCHGPGKAHADNGGDKTKIFDPAEATAKEVTARCQGCHQGKHSNFEHSAHGEANVSCIGCHSIHASSATGTARESLLKAPQTTLCFQCHTEIKPEFGMPFHHKVLEGLVNCSDCHDPHGTFGKKNLRSATQQDMVCVKCHTETAGPFVYEHAAVRTEGCTACHFPHGGPNPRLLNRANVNTVCLQCHTTSPNFSTAGAPTGPVHNQAAQYQSCTICHADIHGSNVNAHFFNNAF